MTGRTDCVDRETPFSPTEFELTRNAQIGFGGDAEIIALTNTGASQHGTAFVLTSVVATDIIEITWQNYMGDGSGADGMAMYLGTNSLEGRVAEDGVPIGFSFCLDEWANAGDHGAMMTFGVPPTEGEANNLKIIWEDRGLCSNRAGCRPITLFETSEWEDVAVKITPSVDGDATVSFTFGDTGWAGTAIIEQYVLPNEVYLGFGARTGGASNNHHVRNVVLKQTCSDGNGAACQRRRTSETLNLPSNAYGCIDPAAENYSVSAAVSDGSCVYDCDALVGGKLPPNARCYLYDGGTERWTIDTVGEPEPQPWAGVAGASRLVVQGLQGSATAPEIRPPLFDAQQLSSQRLSLRTVRMEGNKAFGAGSTGHGAAMTLSNSTLHAEFAEFAANTQNGMGAGVVFAVGSNISASTVLFARNRNLGLGAGVIAVSSGSHVDVSNSQFLGNHVENRQGIKCDCPKDTAGWTDPVVAASGASVGCDAWVGHDCHEPRHGFSPPATILAACPQTCGICTGQVCNPCSGLEGLISTELKLMEGSFYGGWAEGDKFCMNGKLSGKWNPDLDMTTYDPSAVCNINARSDGGSCKEYCESMGRKCMHAQDNSVAGADNTDVCRLRSRDDSGITINSGTTKRQWSGDWYKEENGCNYKEWEDADFLTSHNPNADSFNRASRICGCSSAFQPPHSASCISVTDFSTISATHTLFSGNTGADVIVTRGASTLDVIHTSFRGNVVHQASAAPGPGSRGVVSLWEGSKGNFQSVSFIKNVGTYAGAIFVTSFGTALKFSKIMFVANVAIASDAAAGAIFADAHATIHGTQSAFDGNSAASQVAAGAIYAHNGVALSLTDVTLRDNEAAGHPTDGSVFGAGAVYADTSTVSLIRAGVFSNVAVGGFELTASNYADAMYVLNPPSVYFFNTTFEPLIWGGKTVAIQPNVVNPGQIVQGSCQQWPCALGSSCAFEDYSLTCRKCPVNTYSADGVVCQFCLPGTGPTADQTRCEPCGTNVYDEEEAVPIVDYVETNIFLDFGTGSNVNNSGVSPDPWISLKELAQDEVVALGNGITITALDDGFAGNSKDAPGAGAVVEGVTIPQEANDDYFYKTVAANTGQGHVQSNAARRDDAGTTARLQISGLPIGAYRVTIFEGRTTDSNQVAKIGTGVSASGANSGSNDNTIEAEFLPSAANSGNFAGGSATVLVDVEHNQPLWYRHYEDHTGGISGMVIRSDNSTRQTDAVSEDAIPMEGWTICAKNEGDVCSCLGTVVYGRKYVSGKPGGGIVISNVDQLKFTGFKEKATENTTECSDDAMGGDPYRGYHKHCMCLQGETHAYHSYVGCFIDNAAGARDLDPGIADGGYSDGIYGGAGGVVLTANDPEAAATECMAVCTVQKYTYFGLQWKDQCYCGNSYGSQGEDGIMACDADGDLSSGVADLCGNGINDCGNHNAIYKIGRASSNHSASIPPCPAMVNRVS
jgi:hypothetical protein